MMEFSFCILGRNPICNNLKFNLNPIILYNQLLNCQNQNIFSKLGLHLAPLYCKKILSPRTYFQFQQLSNNIMFNYK